MIRHRWIWFLLAFFSFSVFRATAEIAGGSLPVGWDSLNYYAPWTVAFLNCGVLNQNFIAQQPSVFSLTILMTIATQNVWLSIKIIAPFLYGLLGLSIFFFVSSYLSWSTKKSIFCLMLLMVQPAALRFSWDLFKNELGISLLFFLIPLVSDAAINRKKAATSAIVALSLLLVLTHEFVAVVYFVIMASIIIRRKTEQSLKKYLLCASLPAFTLFLVVFAVYSGGFHASSIAYANVATPHFFKTVYDVNFPAFSVFQNYLSSYSSYSVLFTDTIALFIILYALVLPLVFFGFWDDRYLTPFTLFCFFGAFLPLISPNFALLDFERWMLMLVYPFTIYSANAIFSLVESSRNRKRFLSKLAAKLHLFSNQVIAILYLLFLTLFALSYIAGSVRPIYKPIEGYVPTSLSDAPVSNVAFQDIVSGVNRLNAFCEKNSTIDIFDSFESYDSTLWRQTGGTFTYKDSGLTFTTSRFSGLGFLQSAFGANYQGVITLGIRFNGFDEGASLLDLISIRRLGGQGEGIIYFYDGVNGTELNYWDYEASTSHQITSIDLAWHTLKITCSRDGRAISVDGADKLFISDGQLFGEVFLGRKYNSTAYGGSFSVNYISVKGSLSACLISSFREMGPVWIYADPRVEIIIFVTDLQPALRFAESRPYTTVFVMLTTGQYQGLTQVYETQTYSIYIQ